MYKHILTPLPGGRKIENAGSKVWLKHAGSQGEEGEQVGQTLDLCRWGSSHWNYQRQSSQHWSLASSVYSSSTSDATLTSCNSYLLLASRNQPWKHVIKLSPALSLGQWNNSVSALPCSFPLLQKKNRHVQGAEGGPCKRDACKGENSLRNSGFVL